MLIIPLKSKAMRLENFAEKIEQLTTNDSNPTQKARSTADYPTKITQKRFWADFTAPHGGHYFLKYQN